MRKGRFIKSVVAACVIATMPLSVQALQVYDSAMTQKIQGFMPYIPSVGPHLYRNNTQYLASANGGIKVQLKVGDVLSVPTSLQEAAYDKYYAWADKDSIASTGEGSDIEDKPQINLTFEWYRLETGATTIVPGTNATKLTDEDGVILNDTNKVGPTYTVKKQDVGSQIGFRIKAWSERGLPNEGVYLDVPNVAYLGQQTAPTDPSLPPDTVPPGPGGEGEEHPDIKDKPVGMDNEFIVTIKDITMGENNATIIGEDDPIYVTHQYKAYVERYDPVTDMYIDKTEEFKEFITWNVYKNDEPVYEYLTIKGQINNIPDDPVEFANFDPSKTPFTFSEVEKTEIAAKFIDDNSVFAVQNTNDDALPKAKSLEPNYSEQGLTLKVRLLVD